MCLSIWQSSGTGPGVLRSVRVRRPHRQIFRLTECGFSVFCPATHESNALPITLISDQTNRVHPIRAKLTIREQFVTGLGRRTLVVIRMKQNGHTGQTKASSTQYSVSRCSLAALAGCSCTRWLWMSKNSVNIFNTSYPCYFPNLWLLLEHDFHFSVHFLIPNDFFFE